MKLVKAHGAAIPALGFGTFRMSGNEVAHMIPEILALGYRHIDTAQIYGNEAEVGDGIAASGVARSEIFLTTKVWVTKYPASAFAASVEESLVKLRTDHVDLLLLHWPNDDVPLAEQIGELNRVRERGLTRHIGVSNFTTKLLAQAISLSAAPLVTNQIEYHPYLDQSLLMGKMREAGIALTAYFAMADGKVLDDPVFQEIARRTGRSIAQVALRWLVQQHQVVALTKTVKPDRARSNAAIFDFELSADDMAALSALARPDGRQVSPGGLAPVWD